jgi:hypothetical protein
MAKNHHTKGEYLHTMEKYIVYVVGAFAVIVIICALAMPSSSSSKSNSSTTQPQAVPDVQIDTSAVTTNVWDYIRSKNTTTIGDSNGSNTNGDEPTLTIVVH